MRHRFHAICPYFAMFPESFAERWIGELSQAGDLVVDPFGGRGTTAFQALLMGRRAATCDLNPVAYVLTRAKTCSPTLRSIELRLAELEKSLAGRRVPVSAAVSENEVFFRMAYAPRTLRQLVHLRQELNFMASDVDCMIAALILGALHGDAASERTLSNQMPRTISTKPGYSVRYWTARQDIAPDRDLFAVVRAASSYRYETGRPRRRASVALDDMRQMRRHIPHRSAMLVITSPPYLDTTSYEEDQWLRLWFLGQPPRVVKGKLSRDDRHTNRDNYWRFIADMWRSLGQVVAPGGHVVIRIAGKGLTSDDLRRGLQGTSALSGRSVTLLSSEVSEIKKRQTDAFRPGSIGLRTEVDCVFSVT